jgi:hypothetical protein
MRVAAAFAILTTAGCVASEGPMMSPFEDCLSCHDGGDAKAWTAAGTWARGSHVTITDANGKSFTLRGNDAGNFYTAEPLAFPIRVSVDGAAMPDAITYGGGRGGSCNVCHRKETITTGPLMAPGTDCLICHGPGGMAVAKFSAAGTFRPGDTIQVDGLTTTANSVGNFYYAASAPIAPPAVSRVNGSRMDPDPTYLGCNRCHGRGGEAGGGD